MIFWVNYELFFQLSIIDALQDFFPSGWLHKKPYIDKESKIGYIVE